jgi:hypothetical protein
MTSPKKRLSNRRNAQLSTGPKTTLGKRAASSNAFRHGFSVSMPKSILSPLVKKIADLLVDDVPDDTQAKDLAEKIIEYERNMEAFRQSEDDLLNRADPLPLHAPDKYGGRREMDAAMALVRNHVFPMLGPLPPEGRSTYKERLDYIKSAKSIYKQHIVQIKDQVDSHNNRYLRRARNQLIKALRRVV